MGITPSHLSASTTCPFCGARLLLHESSDFCCLNGRISLPTMPVPPELLSIYNDEIKVANGGEVVYLFRTQGAIYHKIAIIVGGEEAGQLNGRDIVVQSNSSHLMNVSDTAGYYDPLQYPLLLPCGTYGRDVNTQNGVALRTKVTCRDYYSFMLQIRDGRDNLLLRGCRLLQQYAVDIFLKMETQKFRWVRNNQSKIRAEMYNGLQDSFEAGINISGHLGRRIILLYSIVGCPRDMSERFQDAMRVVGVSGRPDLFLTMTCNPSRDEIRDLLLPGQLPQATIHTFKGNDDKLNSSDVYNQIVKAEIPLQSDQPELYTSVLKHMIHGPCGTINPRSPCMQKGKCKRHFTKPFVPYTVQANDCYPLYQRRDMGQVPIGRV
ncbi:putative helitron helicase-like domain-containing protein [Senna tora]|uniref:Putative helitron helicase-like domain-containing protein n=1 Tax=Senna tora TaxID=362788 RepID=A0A834TRA0_9FABA|nr:putative helitron helicase-like domain-containing protein [Senna tora]